MQGLDEAVDLVRDRVDVEARAIRRGHAELAHERLAAVVACPNRDPVEVEHLRDVVRVDAVDVEGDDPGPAVCGRPVPSA